jgi:hypothetical protein
MLLAALPDRDGIFIHRYSQEEAWAVLESAGATREMERDGRLTVVGRVAAFQGDAPRIDTAHVTRVVEGAAEAAERRGRGLYVLADASHAYISEARAQEWFAFELWLGRVLKRNLVLVCLYWAPDVQEADVADAMRRTHLYELESPPVAAP